MYVYLFDGGSTILRCDSSNLRWRLTSYRDERGDVRTKFVYVYMNLYTTLKYICIIRADTVDRHRAFYSNQMFELTDVVLEYYVILGILHACICC